jgi:hypothetical protein
VITWKPVRATVDEWEQALTRMRPLGASFTSGAGPADRAQGQVLWGTESEGQPIGIAWDWAEVRQDVVALCDPMNVLSNVLLVDDRGACLDDDQRIVHLNSAIHEFGWQSEIAAARATQPLALAA